MQFSASLAEKIDPEHTPFYGLIAIEFEQFQYYILGFTENRLLITIPYHMQHCALLREVDILNLCIPFRSQENLSGYFYVESVTIAPEKGRAEYTLRMLNKPFSSRKHYLEVNLCTDDTIEIMPGKDLKKSVLGAVKNMILLKKGISVYIYHLAVYFSRVIGENYRDYPDFFDFFFKNLQEKISTKVRWCTELYRRLAELSTVEETDHTIDFILLESFVDSELNLDTLNLAFTGNRHLPYIIAIKELENMIYLNFNALVLACVKIKQAGQRKTAFIHATL